MTHSDISIPENVKVLQDVRKSGKVRPWKKYKEQNLELAKSYQRNGNDKKADRCRKCGGYLKFGECPNGHEKKLVQAKFCQIRLCPMCSARRSDLVFMNLREVIHVATSREKLRFVFLTLTAKTVNKSLVKDELSKYFDAWQKLAKRRPFKKSVVGWFRALEITHNWKKDSYHPHFHCLLAVRPSYFSHGYIKQAVWAEWWKESLNLDYIPIVDVRTVKPKKQRKDEISETSAILETAKYSVKSGDYLIPENSVAQDIAVEILDDALKNRRLIAYGGILKEIRKELKHVDEDKHNLIKVDDDTSDGCTCSVCNTVYEEVSYHWHVGYKDYVQVKTKYVGSTVIDEETGEILN